MNLINQIQMMPPQIFIRKAFEASKQLVNLKYHNRMDSRSSHVDMDTIRMSTSHECYIGDHPLDMK